MGNYMHLIVNICMDLYVSFRGRHIRLTRYQLLYNNIRLINTHTHLTGCFAFVVVVAAAYSAQGAIICTPSQ